MPADAETLTRQKQPKWFALYSDQCRQAMELFRRQLLTLAEYRRPRRGRRPRSTTFNAIRHANIAQVVARPP